MNAGRKDGSRIDMSQSSPTKTTLPEELKEEIWTWVKRRLWLGGGIFAIVAFFGGKSLIEWTVEKCANRELERARQATYEADMAGRMAKDKAGEAMDAVKSVQAAAVSTRAQLETLQQEIGREGMSIRGLIAKDVDLLRVRLTELEKLVNQVTEVRGVAAEKLVAYNQKIADVEKEAQARDADFQDNAKYSVNVYCGERMRQAADVVCGELTSRGFKVAPPRDIREAQASLSTMHTQAPLVYTKPSRNLDSLVENTVTYTPGVTSETVDEIVSIVSSVPGLAKPKVYTWEYFAADYGEPFFAQAATSQFAKGPVVGLYLVGSQ